MVQSIPNDAVIQQMIKDNTSAQHVQDHIFEVIKSSLDTEQEQQIARLMGLLSSRNFEFMECSRELEEAKKLAQMMQQSFQQETAIRQAIENRHSKLKERFQKLGGKHVESKESQSRAKRDVKKYSSKMNTLSDKVELLESELERMEEELEEARRQVLESERAAAELDRVVVERDTLRQENNNKEDTLSSLHRERDDLKTRLEKTGRDLQKSESERLELRKMYLSISEKIMAVMKSGDFYSSFENMFDILFGNEGLVMESVIKTEDALSRGLASGDVGSVLFLRQKMRDLKQRLHDEMKDNKSVQKQQKKRIKELERSEMDKNVELNEANTLLMRCQNKIEKYRGRYEEEVRYRQKLETNYKRTVGELEYSLSRVKKNHEELQEDFNRRLASRSGDVEIRIRDAFEARISALQREVADKEQQLQKATMEKLIQVQASQMTKQIRQPEQLERMLDVYENKIATYQREYLSKVEHEQRLRELEKKLQDEQKSLIARLDVNTQDRLKQQEEAMNKDFNATLTNIKQAVIQLESSLEEEKKKNVQMVDNLESEQKINSALKATVNKLEERKGELMKHIDETSDGMNRLKEMMNEEGATRRQIQQQLAREQSEVKRQKKQVDDLKIRNDALEQLVSSNKREIMDLKDQNEADKQRYETVVQDILRLTSQKQNLEKEKRKMVESIHSVIRLVQLKSIPVDVNFRGHRNSYDTDMDEDDSVRHDPVIEDLCRDLNRYVTQMCENHERAISGLRSEVDNTRRRYENGNWQKRQDMHRMEIILREKIALLKKELGQVRSTTDKEMLTLRHAVEKYMESLVRRANEQCSRSNEALYELQRNFDGESSMLKSRFQKELRDHEGELKQVKSNMHQKITQLESLLRTAMQEKNNVEHELAVYRSKFAHLKDMIRVLNSYVPLNSDVQTGLLSDEDKMVERAMEDLRKVLEENDREKEERNQLSHQWEERFTTTRTHLETLEISNKSLREELDMIRKQNKDMSQTQKQNTEAYQSELRSLYGQLETLQQKYRDEINRQSELKDSGVHSLRKSYEQKLEELQKKIETDTKRFSDISRDRKKLQAELEKVRNQLEESLQEIERKKTTIREMSAQNQRQLENNNQELQELRIKLAEKEERLKREEVAKQRYRDKTNRKQQAITELQNLLENTVRATSAVDTSIFSSPDISQRRISGRLLQTTMTDDTHTTSSGGSL